MGNEAEHEWQTRKVILSNKTADPPASEKALNQLRASIVVPPLLVLNKARTTQAKFKKTWIFLHNSKDRGRVLGKGWERRKKREGGGKREGGREERADA